MRKFSRHMPKQEENLAAGWVVISLLVAAATWFIFEHPWLLIVAGVLSPWAIVSMKTERQRLLEMREARKNESICTFARSFDRRAVDPWIIRAVYEQLEPYQRIEDVSVPLRATDSIFQDLKVPGNDFDYDVTEIAQRCGRSLRSYETNPFYGKIDTVADLVHFLNAQPVAQPKTKGVVLYG